MAGDAARAALAGVRGMIDGVDDAMLALLAGRRGLVRLAAQLKLALGQPGRDLEREREIYRRARRLSLRLGLPATSSDRLLGLLIDDACSQQQLAATAYHADCPDPDLDQCRAVEDEWMMASKMEKSTPISAPFSWLRLLPPPTRLTPLLRRVPLEWQGRLLEAALRSVLATALANGALAALESRRLGIEVSDLGLRWVIEPSGGRIRVDAGDAAAESTVRGTATDLLLLASRREDADTLFFQRRLLLTGDTELGLTARNLLDQLPWQEVPLGLRIALHRVAGLAQAARAAYRDRPAPA
jgi:predicted lipid carrier protein YhbT/chorismate mutase